MSSVELNSAIGTSFLEDESLFDPLIPSQVEQKIYSNVFEALQPNHTDIVDKEAYLTYLKKVFDQMAQAKKPIPHKAWIQLEMAQKGINEAKTRIVPTSDLATVLHYTLYLLSIGHKEVWWGTADIDDQSDPQGKQNISPPLYKKICNFQDCLLNIACVYEFAKLHPNSYMKVFPQDKDHPSLCSLLVSSGENRNNLVLKVRRGEFTPEERTAREVNSTVEINIDLNDKVPKVMVKNASDLVWLKILLNSSEMFRLLDQIKTKGSNFINPEFLVFGLDPNAQISFFTDIIYGAKATSGEHRETCPKILPILKILAEGKAKVIVTSENPGLADLISNRYSAEGAAMDLRSLFYEIEQGGFHDRQSMFAAMAQLRRYGYRVPKSVMEVYRSNREFASRPNRQQIASLVHLILAPKDRKIRTSLGKHPRLKAMVDLPKIQDSQN